MLSKWSFLLRFFGQLSGSAPEMLGQARALFALCEGLDLDYMERRIREETMGEYGIESVQG